MWERNKFTGELVTTTFMFKVVPYHEGCYAKDLKGLRTFFVSNNPVNGISGNITAVLSIFIGIFALLFLDGFTKSVGLLAFVAVGYRLYSYIQFEKSYLIESLLLLSCYIGVRMICE